MIALVTGTDIGRVHDQVKQIQAQFLANVDQRQVLHSNYDANLNTETQLLSANTLTSLFHTHHVVTIKNIDKLKDKTLQMFTDLNLNTLTVLTSEKTSAVLKTAAKRNGWNHYVHEIPTNVNTARSRNMQASEDRQYALDKTTINLVTQLCVDDILTTDSVMRALHILQSNNTTLDENLITSMCTAASPGVKSRYGKQVVEALMEGSLDADQYMSVSVNMTNSEQLETFKWVLRRRSDKKTPAIVASCAIAAKIPHELALT